MTVGTPLVQAEGSVDPVTEATMPLIIVTLAIAVLLGLYAPRRIALAVTTAAAAITLFAHVWATADGTGDDPWWIILVGAASAAAAIVLCERVSAARSRRDSSTSISNGSQGGVG